MYALRAIQGLAVNTIKETEKELVAKAIEEGYLYREGDMLYTKILVSNVDDRKDLFASSSKLEGELPEIPIASIADRIADLIKKSIPEHLWGEWECANLLAALPILDALVEILIDNGILTPSENGIGAEGCWVSVK